MKIYIAGKITGDPRCLGKFRGEAERLEQAYCSYIGKPSGGSWEEDT